MGESYYELLGVAPDAPDEEIERAYRERLKETHPDVSDDEDASERTRRLIEAKEVLSDETERARYDRLGHDAFVEAENAQSGAESSPTERGAGRTADRTRGTGSGGTTDTESASTTSSSATAGSTAGGANSSGYGTAASGASGTGGTAASDGTTAGAGGTANRTGRNQRGNHVRDDSWYGSSGRAGSDVDSTDDWQAWNSQSSFAVTRDGDRYRHGRMFDDQRAMILLAITFVVYPVLLFGALVPQFPVAVNLTVAMCVVLVIAFLQSIPEVGIAVFGVWSVLLPLTMFWVGIDFASLRTFFAIVAVIFPLGLSVLTRVAIRPVSAG